ncbi:MAG TPA: PRC-barrel domain-containing protein [Azonexus sp.]|nr:PRC-barrel domain-containing protein [Azonexus sp.]
MTNIHRFGLHVAASVLAASLAGPLLAADRPAGQAATEATGQNAQTATRDLRASKVIGMKVRNAQDQDLGKIDDLIVDVNNERVAYAILSFGGVLGLGQKLFTYPLSLFQPAPGRNDELVLNVEEERLKKAPGFERKNWPDWNQSSYRGDVDRYFGPTVSPKAMPNQRLVRASELIGKNVDDSEGHHAGELKDLVVNLGNARVHYAVFDLDKAWSPNDKLVPVTLHTFNFPTDRSKKDIVLKVGRNDLDMSQGFDAGKWPDVSDPAYQRNIDSYLQRSASKSRSTGAAGPVRE